MDEEFSEGSGDIAELCSLSEGLMEGVLGRFAPQVYALMRIVVGLLFACHGAQKLFGLFGGPQMPLMSLFGLAGIIEFFGAALAVVGTSQLFFSEIEQRTIFALFAKPISHEVYLIGKFVGMLGLITFFGP